MNTSPDAAYSRFPTGNTRSGNPRKKFRSVFRPSGSAIAETTSGGLFNKMYTRRPSFASTTRPAASIRSLAASAFVPSSRTTRPFTFTCPLRISSSACRREAIPARAIIFCSLSSIFFFVFSVSLFLAFYVGADFSPPFIRRGGVKVVDFLLCVLCVPCELCTTNPRSLCFVRQISCRLRQQFSNCGASRYFTGRPRASALALQACFNLSLTGSTCLPNSVSRTCFAQPVAQHSFRIADRPPGPSKDQPVEATQHSRNLFPMFGDKLLHGVSVPPKIWPSCRTTTSYRERKRLLGLVAALPRCVNSLPIPPPPLLSDPRHLPLLASPHYSPPSPPTIPPALPSRQGP